METSIIDKYLVNGEKVTKNISLENCSIKDSTNTDLNLFLTNKRLIYLNEEEDKFNDIKFGNIVSVGWHYKTNSEYLNGSIFCFFCTAIFGFLMWILFYELFPYAGYLPQIVIDIMWLLIIIGLFLAILCLIYYLYSKHCNLFISTKGCNKHEYIIKGPNAKNTAINLCLNIRNADEGIDVHQ